MQSEAVCWCDCRTAECRVKQCAAVTAGLQNAELKKLTSEVGRGLSELLGGDKYIRPATHSPYYHNIGRLKY